MGKEALEIRDGELGSDHPYTISTKSNLGAVIASQVLHTMHVKKTKISKYSMSLWDTAEEHLREALDLSVQNPQGQKIDIPNSASSNNNSNSPSASKDIKKR